MTALLRTEFRKLGGSLALLLAVAVPALPALLVLLGMATSRRVPAWGSVYTSFALPIWAMFLMPMTVAAFTALVAGIEHRGRGWDHLLALPIRRWQLFVAKLVVVLASVVAMTVLMIALATVAGFAGGAIRGAMPVGAVPWALLARIVPALLAAGAALVVSQLWVALRFASFVVPLAVGIAGTLVTLAAMVTRTTKVDYWPWMLPLKTLQPDEAGLYAAVGGIGGALLAVAMIADLSRRSFR